eukprot:GHVU01033657.1.p1 GENE.GHVU01033657.1~~GHVU01033657.1.p1  ORF type:complete len:168 (+),score=33.89 GHVU01033657.1:68-571(+)
MMMLKCCLVQLVLIVCVSATRYVGSNKKGPSVKLDIIDEAIELGGPVIKDGTPIALLVVKDEDSVTCTLDTDKLRLEDTSSEWTNLPSTTTVYTAVVNGQLDVATDVPFFLVASCTDGGTPARSTAVRERVDAGSSDESQESQESNSQESNSQESKESDEEILRNIF